MRGSCHCAAHTAAAFRKVFLLAIPVLLLALWCAASLCNDEQRYTLLVMFVSLCAVCVVHAHTVHLGEQLHIVMNFCTMKGRSTNRNSNGWHGTA